MFHWLHVSTSCFPFSVVYFCKSLLSSKGYKQQGQHLPFMWNGKYSMQINCICISILETKREEQGRTNTSNWYLLDLVSAALTSRMTGWSGACTHSLENGFADRLQEGQVLHIKHTHTDASKRVSKYPSQVLKWRHALLESSETKCHVQCLVQLG